MLIKRKIDLVILAGGKGSRIKKYLKGNPKPMLKFNKKYFLNYILKKTCTYNFEKIYILTRFKSDIIFNHLNIDFLKPVTIVEGVFDAVKSGLNSASG